MTVVPLASLARGGAKLSEEGCKAIHIAIELLEHPGICLAALGLAVAIPQAALLMILTLGLVANLRRLPDDILEMGAFAGAFKLAITVLHALTVAMGWLSFAHNLCRAHSEWLHLWHDPFVLRPVVWLVGGHQLWEWACLPLLHRWLGSAWLAATAPALACLMEQLSAKRRNEVAQWPSPKGFGLLAIMDSRLRGGAQGRASQRGLVVRLVCQSH